MKFDKNKLKTIIAVNNRVIYWEEILYSDRLCLDKEWDKFINCLPNDFNEYSIEDVDNYIKENYAAELKNPDVIERILGNKNNE